MKAENILPKYTAKSIKMETKVAKISISPQDLKYVRQVVFNGKRYLMIEIDEDAEVEGFKLIPELFRARKKHARRRPCPGLGRGAPVFLRPRSFCLPRETGRVLSLYPSAGRFRFFGIRSRFAARLLFLDIRSGTVAVIPVFRASVPVLLNLSSRFSSSLPALSPDLGFSTQIPARTLRQFRFFIILSGACRTDSGSRASVPGRHNNSESFKIQTVNSPLPGGCLFMGFRCRDAGFVVFQFHNRIHYSGRPEQKEKI